MVVMNEITPKTKRPVDRSPAYPSIDLRQAVEICGKIFDLFSEYGFSREVASEKLGLPVNSNSFRKIAALVQYGLLKREGNNYKITSLSKDIILAVDEIEKQKALTKAAMQPTIFNKLIKENTGKGLPLSLDIRLRQLEYSKDASKSLSEIFKRSLEYSGLLSNGIVVVPEIESVENSPVNNNITMEVQTIIPTKENSRSEKPSNTHTDLDIKDYLSYPLDCGIIVKFPLSMVKKMMSGVFKNKLDELEDLGRNEDETTASNATDTPVE